MNWFTIIVLCFIATLKLEAAEVNDTCTIYLKNGQNLDMKFHEVQSFCFVNEKGEGVNYHVIDSLKTSDSTIAKTIFQSSPGITLNSSNDGYVLNFLNYIPSRVKQESIIPFKPSSIALSFRIDPSSQIGFIYDAELFNIKHFIHRFQSAIGFRNKESIFSSIVFAFGLGYQLYKDDIRFSFAANYGLYRESPELKKQSTSGYLGSYSPANKANAPAISGTVFFISQTMSYKFSNSSPYFLTTGFDFYLNRERKELPKNPIILYLGIGTDL